MFLTPSLLTSLCLLQFCAPCHGQQRFNVNYPALRQTAYGYSPLYSYQPTYTPVGNYLPRKEYSWVGQTRNVVQKAYPGYTSNEEYGVYNGPYNYKRTSSTQQQTITPVGYGVWPQPVTPVKNSGRSQTTWEYQKVHSSRICSPGPPLEVNRYYKNCLVIGDSISLGYLPAVKRVLKGLCQVQHAPFAKASGAVDSAYGLKCLPMMLSTTSLGPTKYDAIVFNFGMHDIDFSRRFHEEYVPLPEYRQNLQKLKRQLLDSGAALAFALTTPVPFDVAKNTKVQEYNQVARSVMEEEGNVDVIDMYSEVRKMCGNPPYRLCRFMKKPKDVPKNPPMQLSLRTISGITPNAWAVCEEKGIIHATRLLVGSHCILGSLPVLNVPELYAREGLASYSVQNDSSLCPDMLTRCPTDTTCCESLMSLTGYGCCMFPQAVRCPDNWHCCPLGQSCSPDCNFKSCRCIRLVPSQKKAIPISKAFSTKGRKYHTARTKGNKENGSLQRKFKSRTKQPHLESHKTGKLKNLRHRNTLRRKHWGKTAKKLGHRVDSAKEELGKKHRKNKKQVKMKKAEKARTTKAGKPTVALKAAHRRYHSTTKTKLHISNPTKISPEAHNEKGKVSYQPKNAFNHFSNFTTAGRSKNKSKKKNTKLIASKIKSQTTTSMTDELEHLIKKHRNKNVHHVGRPNVHKRLPGNTSKQNGEVQDKIKDLGMKKPALATIINPVIQKEVVKETKALFPSKKPLPNNDVSEPEQTPLRITAHAQNSSVSHGGGNGKGKPVSFRKENGNKTILKKIFSKENRTKGRFKAKDAYKLGKKRPYKKSGHTFVKETSQTGSNGVLHKNKIYTSRRIPTWHLHTKPKTSHWDGPGSYAGEADVSGKESEERTHLRQLHFHGESSYKEASGINSEESGSHQVSGKHSLGYQEGEDKVFQGESGYDLSYGHLQNNLSSQNVGSGSAFGSNLWQTSKTLAEHSKGRSMTQLEQHKGNTLERKFRKRTRLSLESGIHKAEWSAMGSHELHSHGSGEGSGEKLAHAPQIPKLYRPTPYKEKDIANSGSGSTEIQEPNRRYNKSSRVKNADITGEDSDQGIDNNNKQPEENDLMSRAGEEDISTEESTPVSGEFLQEQDQDFMESLTGKPEIHSGEESDKDNFSAFSGFLYESKPDNFGGGSELIGGEGLESNEREVEASGAAEHGMGSYRAAKVKRKKSRNLTVKFRKMREKLKSDLPVPTEQLTMGKESDGQNSETENIASRQLKKDHWLKHLQHGSGHLAAEFKNTKEIINYSRHLKKKDKHFDVALSGLVAKPGKSQSISPGVNIESVVQDTERESSHGTSDGSGLSSTRVKQIYTKHEAGITPAIHARDSNLADRMDAQERKLKAFGSGDYKDQKHKYHSFRSFSRRGKKQRLSLSTAGARAKASSRENHHDDTISGYGSSGHLKVHRKALQPPESSGVLPDNSYLDQLFNDFDHDHDGSSEDSKTDDDLGSSSGVDEDLDDDDDEDDEDWSSDTKDETYL